MDRKLTAKQVKKLAAFHKRAVRGHGAVKPGTMRILGPEEAAKLWPGIVTHYEINVKRPPNEDSAHE